MTANSETKLFPPVVLDTTLYDLLVAEQDDRQAPLETLCQLKPNSDKEYGTAVPLSNKYIIHSAQVGDGDDLAHLQLENCSHLLMFFAGPMDVMFLAAEGESDDPTLSKDSVYQNAKKSFDVIQEDQRPHIKTYANIEDCVTNHDGSKVRWGFAMDFAERLPYLFHPELVYELNSKRWLAVSETLKSANDEILDCHIKCEKHQHETSRHRQEWYYGGPDCQQCTAGIEAEMHRVRTVIQQRSCPFVLKLTQSLSAVGTNIIKNDKEKDELVEKMTKYLSTYLPRIAKENAYLHTTSLILSDHIPGETMALNFFVRRDGSPIFLGACHQLATGESGRQATAITYADQEKLAEKFRCTLEKIGQALGEAGFYGVVGADVMEDKNGMQYTIDLNVRSPLSLVLYLLKGHFNDKRGLGVSLIYECVMLKISREELEKRFVREFEEARIVLLGSTKIGENEKYAYGMVVAGQSQKEIDNLSERIFELEA